MQLTITNAQSRRLVLNLQALAQPTDKKLTDSSLHETICQLGFVQIDSIRWVERAQHMILFSRSDHYRPDALKRLIEVKRTLFENYTHDASIIPCEFFRYWRRKFVRDQDRIRKNFAKWQGDGFLDQCDAMVQRIVEGGPLKSRDLKESKQGSGEMWQWNDSKTALEYLWRTGTLAIAARYRFEKIYDLIENAIPDREREAECSESDFIDWACRSALDRLGVGSAADIAGFWKLVSIAEVRSWLSQNKQDVDTVLVETVDGETKKLFAHRSIESIVEKCVKLPNRLRILSPFDPVIRDRNRLAWMFNFDYRIEIYVPEAKRKYGYYVFPILDGEKIVGRIDMKADRQTDTLVVKKVWWEPGVKVSGALKKRMRDELHRQARLADVANVDPSGL